MIRHPDGAENEIRLKIGQMGCCDQHCEREKHTEMQTLIPSPVQHSDSGLAATQSLLGTRMEGRPSCSGQSLLVVSPRVLNDAPTVIDAVRSNRVVVVNSGWLEDAPGQRLIDFICGGLAAIGGQVHRIDEEVFLFAPASARIGESETSS